MINNFKPKISAIFHFDRINDIWMVPMFCVKASLFKKFEMAAFDFCNFDKKNYDSFWYKWQNNFYKLSLPMTEPEPWCWNSFCKAVEGLVRKFSSSCPSTCSELEFLFRGLPSPQFNTYKIIIKNKCGQKVVNYTWLYYKSERTKLFSSLCINVLRKSQIKAQSKR